MDAQASGLTTENAELRSMSTLSATHSASAPPLPPSPVITLTTGTVSPLMATRFWAMASPWPRSSAPIPQYAPEVSTRHSTGRPNFWAWRMRRRAFR